jgi:hypothetical protein
MEGTEFIIAVLRMLQLVPTKELIGVVAISPLIVSVLTEACKRLIASLSKVSLDELTQQTKTNVQFAVSFLVSAPVVASIIQETRLLEELSFNNVVKTTFVIFTIIALYGKISTFYYKGIPVLNWFPYLKDVTLKNAYGLFDSTVEKIQESAQPKEIA